MAWIEIFELRSACGAVPGIEEQLAHLPGPQEEPDLHFYRRALIDGDFLLTILHRSGPPEPRGPELGLRFAAALEDSGIVNHTVWTTQGESEPE